MATTLENEVIKELALQRKKDRRWRNIRFFILIFLILFYLILLLGRSTQQSPGLKDSAKPYVALIRLNGVIMPGKNFSAAKVIPRLKKAFADKKARGVILDINSPGGSPVQASIIHDQIIVLKKKYPRKKVIVVGEDALASGAYLVATAADKIYVSPDTLTGSIGVVLSSFGLNKAIQKLGISRRLYTSGDNKARLDPFEPLNPQDVKKIHSVLNQVHQNFIDDVINGRGDKLRGNRQELFSGDFWTGQQAVKLGLADGTGNLWSVMKSQFHVNQYRNYSIKPSLLHSLFSGVDSKLNLGLQDNQTSLKEVLY